MISNISAPYAFITVQLYTPKWSCFDSLIIIVLLIPSLKGSSSTWKEIQYLIILFSCKYVHNLFKNMETTATNLMHGSQDCWFTDLFSSKSRSVMTTFYKWCAFNLPCAFALLHAQAFSYQSINLFELNLLYLIVKLIPNIVTWAILFM